ncbi:MAG: hypothetical protein IT422_24990 [Pirellulaceae bacterium]|nr:hypothetical protein [Pirellulaceae bacterium]
MQMFFALQDIIPVRGFITALALPSVDTNRNFQVTTADRLKDILHRTATRPNGNHPEALPTWLSPIGCRARWAARQTKAPRTRSTPKKHHNSERALTWIARYVEHAREQLAHDPKETTLFLTIDSTPLNPDSVTEYGRRYIKAADE